MALPTFTLSFVNTPPFYSGSGTSALVPSVFPVAINGRPYMVDQKSGRFQRGYEQRVRDSQDISTAPGEAAINPGGLWRRGQDSWHLGAGQRYADTADSQDYRFWESKGVDVWTKGQLSLLNATKLSLTSAATNLKLAVTSTRVYVLDGSAVKYTTDPFASSPTWSTASGLPTGTPVDIASDGTNVYITYPGLNNTHGLWKYTPADVASNVSYGHEFGNVDFVKGFFITTGNAAQGNGNDLYFSPTGNVSADDYEHPVSTFEWIASAAGQNAIYIAGKNGDFGSVYKLTIKTDGTLDTPVQALELPRDEYPTDIHGYLGFIVLGTNKGVRFCSSDNNGNLVAGSLIATSGPVRGFTAEGKFVWFGWTNYDGASSGLGRLDLSQFTSANTPAYATDLMYSNIGAVLSAGSFGGKRLFSISGVGVVAEDSANLVSSGSIESGIWRWGIPDRKFVAKVDTRAEPLVGSIAAAVSTDTGEYETLATWNTAGSVEYTFEGKDDKAIEAQFRFTLTRATATTGPVLTRWMARAYVTPFRSQVFVVPLILHNKIRVKDRDYYFDVQKELDALDTLISSPQIIILQLGNTKHSVILEDIEWTPLDFHGNEWDWEGTATVTLRSVEN